MKPQQAVAIMAAALLLIICAALLIGCGPDDRVLTRGKVIDRDYEPAWTQNVPVGNGVNVPITYEAECSVKVQGSVNEETVTEWHDDDCLNPLRVGEWWEYDG